MAPPSPRARVVRLGLDFGTSTTMIAARIDDAEPVMLRLEQGSESLPSYIALLDGEVVVGTRARQAGVSKHSVKLDLPENEPIPELDGMRPEVAAIHIVRAAVEAALLQLRSRGLLPDQADLLTVATNVGCTPAFDLVDRSRLLDICRAAGLKVEMASLIEEPVAAAFAVARAAMADDDGGFMVIDIGGGTTDVAVIEMARRGRDFTLHATGGRRRMAGDRLTEVLVAHLQQVLAARRGVPITDLALTNQERTALWARAEAAKIDLSTLRSVRIALPDEGETVEVTREAYEAMAKPVVDEIVQFVEGVYRQARLTLGRGGSDDDVTPGQVSITTHAGVVTNRVTSFTLEADAPSHIAHLALVGGAARMPMIQRRFEAIFGDRLRALDWFGVEPDTAIVLGLARHEPMSLVGLRRPNWGAIAELHGHDGSVRTAELYEPFQSTYRIRFDAVTATARTVVPGLQDVTRATIWFVPLSTAAGETELSLPVEIPPGSRELSFALDLLGRYRVAIDGRETMAGVAPFIDRDVTPSWLMVRSRRCPHGAVAGECWVSRCSAHVRAQSDSWRLD